MLTYPQPFRILHIGHKLGNLPGLVVIGDGGEVPVDRARAHRLRLVSRQVLIQNQILPH